MPAVLSPYPIPGELRGRKVTNLGDGFILRAVERLLGRFDPRLIFSPRVAPSPAQLSCIAEAGTVIIAGANQLNDQYTVWPGLDGEGVRKSGIRFVPFGVGIHGEPARNKGMSPETRAVLEAIHERLEYSSWRCPRTIRYLEDELPHLKGRFLMTGCPVIYDTPLLQSSRFDTAERSVAVTVTERGDFWLRETQVVDAVCRRFPRARRYLVIHQNFAPPHPLEALAHRIWKTPLRAAKPIEALRRYARQRGFTIVIPRDADACAAFYKEIDVHVGSRLHAHLLFLSLNKRSHLVAVDDRARGMAEFLGFPLLAPEELEHGWDFDFEAVRQRALTGMQEMKRFLHSLAA